MTTRKPFTPRARRASRRSGLGAIALAGVLALGALPAEAQTTLGEALFGTKTSSHGSSQAARNDAPRDTRRPNRDIVSPVAEANEDCDALRHTLRRQRDSNTLSTRDFRELRRAGC